MNEDLVKEADFFRDIVIVPFADSYELVVLKTVAICDYVVCSTRVDIKQTHYKSISSAFSDSFYARTLPYFSFYFFV